MKCKVKKSLITLVFVMCMVVLTVFIANAEDASMTESTVTVLDSGAVVEAYTNIEKVKECRTEGAYTEPIPPEGYTDYKFAGWFLDVDCAQVDALGEDVTSEGIQEGTTYYAKFVSKGILTIKAQVKAGTTFDPAETPKSDIRFVSTVDSSDYKCVGFDFLINGKDRSTGEITTVYKKLYAVSDTNEVLGYTPKAFHSMSEYFFAWNVRNVPNAAFGQGMAAKPYWITLDGTKVYGTEDTKTVNMGYMPAVTEATTTEVFSISLPWSTMDASAQGGCTDGTYYYQACYSNYYGVKIKKYNMATGDEITSEVLALDHGNDMTYNSELGNGVLVVCNNQPNPKRVSFVDPEDLSIISPASLGFENIEGSVTVYDTYIELKADFFGIDYNAYMDKYVLARSSKYGFWLYDSKFNDLNMKWSHNTATKDFTSQGIGTDDSYIYNLLHNANGGVEGYAGHVIEVYDWDGNLVTVINLPTDSKGISTSLEVENISVYQNTIYIACHNKTEGKATVYKVTGLEQEFEASIGSKKYMTLKDAVEDADAGDTITVLKDITVNSTIEIFDDLTITNTVGKDITITRGTSLTGYMFENNSGKTFKIEQASSGTLAVDGNKENVQGKSLVYNGSTSTFVLTGAALQNAQTNSSSAKNGAALNNQGTAMLNGNVKDNYAAEHGAILNQGTLTISGGEYSGNSAVKDGGVVYTTTNVSINGGTFTGNSATQGGVVCRGGGTITLTINGGTFTGNTATNAGGVIHWGSGTMNISNVSMTGNSVSAESTLYGGGAISVGGSTKLTLTNVEISGNALPYIDNDHPGCDIVFVDNGSTYPYLILADSSFDGVVSWYKPNNQYKGRVQFNEAYTGNGITFCKTSCLEIGDTLVEFGADFTEDKSATVNNITVREYTSSESWDENTYCIAKDGTLQTYEASITNADNTTTHYSTFAEAINAANESESTEQITITVLRDITMTNKPTISKNIKVRANNKTIDIGSLTGGIFTVKGQLEFDGYNGGILTIEGNAASRDSSNTRIVLNDSGTFTLGENAVIQNLDTGWQGGAVYNNGTGKAYVYGDIKYIVASNQGGALYNNTNASLTIDGSAIASNQGSEGGAIHNRGTLVIADSKFNSNVSTTRGGAICNSGTMTINGCSFYQNKNNGTGADGGAIYNTSSKDNVISNTIFVENHSARNGGAIANQNNSANLALKGCGFKKNTCNTSGGAICNHGDTTISIEDTWFVDNTKTTYTDATTGIKIVGLYNGGTISKFENITTVEPEAN